MVMALDIDRTLQFRHGATRVCVGSDLLVEAGRLCREIGGFSRALVVTDDNLAKTYAAPVREALDGAGIASDLAVVPAGEGSKSVEQAEQLYGRLADWQVGRDGLIVAVGGGMVTDLAGFVGATWLRGMATVLCPTTLEADIDAAIGGKTAINHARGKNLIGAFHHPRLVVIDTRCLETLSQRDLVSGLAESVKHAVITGESFFAWHEEQASKILDRDHDTIVSLIEQNIEIKGGFVARDEREESGVRAMLNFGHTIGHAIEAWARYRLRHGECVSLGMVAACRLSEALHLIEGDAATRIEHLLHLLGLPTVLPERVDEHAIWELLKHDKKVVKGSLRFVLIEGMGRPVLRSEVPEAAVRDAIAGLQPGPK
ncbi:MAG: 3-dehydroquinate synthase [Phycisphaerae bacterium]